jgi:polysaccharide transporter, PST family
VSRFKLTLQSITSHPVTQNSLALYCVEVANYVVPLATIPYLARVLRPHGWGLIVFAQSLTIWLALLIEYGFNFSATREIARNRDNPQQVSAIVSGVVWARVPLIAFSGLIALVAGLAVPILRVNHDYLLWAWLGAVGQGLSPLWYFQGKERMRAPAALNVGARILAAASIFVLVKSTGDGWKALASQAVAVLLATGVAHAWVFREIGFQRPVWSEMRTAMRMGWHLFVCGCATSIYASASTFILGFFCAPAIVGYYGGAQKLKSVLTSHLWPFWRAMYPRMSYLVRQDRKKAGQISRKMTLALMALAVCVILPVEKLAPTIVRLALGPEYASAVPVFRILALSVLPITINGMLGIQWMLPLGMDRAFNAVTVIVGVVSLSSAIVVAPRWGATGMAVVTLVSEILLGISMALAIRLSRPAELAPAIVMEPAPDLEAAACG